ncbi:hypothetical protein ACPOL_1955 [Acidisarcina polymorpha]|uniref:Uncharacterized protein n=2 Tax=Acidisarcina polymorpha TaxID=2211140 RepID=A0A2Z5FWT0_9BACT|nr:hypothetical protein ACPOL_1955 [Acidisarcina polymorpha]
MEFADKPNFTVAGVTDWTAVGGHGSDASLRTSEALARETSALKSKSLENSSSPHLESASKVDGSESELRAALVAAPAGFEANRKLGIFYLHAGRYQESIPLLEAAYKIDPSNRENEYDLALAYNATGDYSRARGHVRALLAKADRSDLHRLAGELDEKLGDPLSAVHEQEQAARLDPSEQNYFEWGSELLLHRAMWQAVEVFGNGAKAYPKSPRMLAALGAALFATARYEEASLRLCEASDLNPADPEPYIFMGKIEMASPTPLPCIGQRLANFVQQQPDNPIANYLDAMALLRREQAGDQQSSAETMLKKAVALDPKCGEAYLQLGILAFSRHDIEQAIDRYRRAIEVNPELGEAHYRLGVVYDRIGKPAEAKQEFQIHDEIERVQAAAIERERRDVKQFLVVSQSQPASSASH